jgi:Trypsin-co-occurring domain 1
MRTVAMTLDSGQTVFVEVEQTNVAADEFRSKTSAQATIVSRLDFKKTIAQIQEPVATIMETFQNLPIMPDKLNVEFSVKFSGEGGIIFASAKGEAGLVVRFEWTPASKTSPS